VPSSAAFHKKMKGKAVSPSHRSSIGRDDKTKLNSKVSAAASPKIIGVTDFPTTKSIPSIKLPSLSEDALLMAKPSFQSFNASFSSNDFALSVPVFRRTRFDLFGMDGTLLVVANFALS